MTVTAVSHVQFIFVSDRGAAYLTDWLAACTLLETEGATARLIPADQSPGSDALGLEIPNETVGRATGYEAASGILLQTSDRQDERALTDSKLCLGATVVVPSTTVLTPHLQTVLRAEIIVRLARRPVTIRALFALLAFSYIPALLHLVITTDPNISDRAGCFEHIPQEFVFVKGVWNHQDGTSVHTDFTCVVPSHFTSQEFVAGVAKSLFCGQARISLSTGNHDCSDEDQLHIVTSLDSIVTKSLCR